MPLTLEPDVDDATTLIHIQHHACCDDPLSPPHTDEIGSLSSLTAEYVSIGDLLVPIIADTFGGTADVPRGTIPTRLPFRGDLDESQQLALCRKDRHQACAAATLREWAKTFASKDDHCVFLKMLVVESFKQPLPQHLVETRKQRAKKFVQRIHNAFRDVTVDPYAAVLDQIAAEKLFTCDSSCSAGKK
jgi:hypothetical protein